MYRFVAWTIGGIVLLPILCVHAARGQGPERAGDPVAAAPAVRPIAVVSGLRGHSWEWLPREEATRLGFAALAGALGNATIGDDPNLSERTAFPYGRVRWDDHSKPNSLNLPGLFSVSAYRTVYDAHRVPLEGGAGDHEEILWRWQPPDDHKKIWPAGSWWVWRDRCTAICGVMCDWSHEPYLWRFSGDRGLDWQATVPFRERIEQYARDNSLTATFHRLDMPPHVQVGVTMDGSATLVAAGWDDPPVSFVFVFDSVGHPTRVVEMPRYMAHDSLRLDVRRSPTARLFAFHFEPVRTARWTPPTGGPLEPRVSQACLFDDQGVLLGRFVDDRGAPVAISNMSDTHALGYRKDPDGTCTQLVYELPAAPRSVHPTR